MKEKLDERKTQKKIERDSVEKKNGRGKERSKKKTKLFIFFKKKIRKNKTMFCQNVRNIWKKSIFKRGKGKTLENVFKDMVRYGEKGGKGHLPETK